jgi:NADPH-dependent curcumin reductase CurA
VSVASRGLRLARRPSGRLEPGCFELVETTVPDPADGEVLVRNLWLSVDAAARVRLAESTPEGYLPPFGLHEPLAGLAVGEVVASRARGFAPGDVVTHALGYREHAVVRPGDRALAGAGGLSVVDTAVAPPEAYLGVLGHIGLTAYAGLLHVADLRDGDVVWVSAAAGAVGSVAAQLARCLGHTVVGSAGSPQKVRYLLDDLGLDAAFDHRDGDLADLLRAAAPSGIDVYFDNVGGAHLEAALSALRDGGRVVLCGAVSEYEGGPSHGPRNMFQIVAKSLQLRGFRAGSFTDRTAEMRTVLGTLLSEGRLTLREHVVDGLESAPEALVALLNGGNTGKVLVRLPAGR